MGQLRESNAVCLPLFFGPWLVRPDVRQREHSFRFSWMRP